MYANVASVVERYKDQVDLWLYMAFPFSGVKSLIIGNLEVELKLDVVQAFTTPLALNKTIPTNNFHSRKLFATASCIGEGLDFADIYTVICIGFPTSILDLIQEMGCYGRRRSNNGSTPTGFFILVITL